jgi:hypothetical protein
MQRDMTHKPIAALGYPGGDGIGVLDEPPEFGRQMG